jgi:hypothetical protein
MDQVISENQLCGEDDNVESDGKEQRWWQDLEELFSYECEET